jgi:hypothetical protein
MKDSVKAVYRVTVLRAHPSLLHQVLSYPHQMSATGVGIWCLLPVLFRDKPELPKKLLYALLIQIFLPPPNRPIAMS